MLITKDAAPYSLYLNFDKVFVGIIFLYITSIASLKDLDQIIIRHWKVFVITTISLISLSYLIGYVKFVPKIPTFTLLWIISNLLMTCVTEEVFFRFFLQKNLQDALSKKFAYGELIGLIITSCIFGLFYYKGDMNYVFLASIAGYCYGSIFNKAKRIEASILLHFFVNIVHFLLFTYPRSLDAASF